MGLNYTTDLDDEDERSLEEALRAAADERRGYVATPDPASSVAEAGTRAPALTAPRAPVAPPTFIPEPEPERDRTPGPTDDLSTGMPDDVRAFEDGMVRYRTSNGRLPDLPAGDLEMAADPDAVMDDMTEDEILRYAAESDPYSTPEQDERDPAEAPVGKVRNATAIKGMGGSKDASEDATALLADYDMSALDELEHPRMIEDTSAADEAADLLSGYDMSALDRVNDPSIAGGGEPSPYADRGEFLRDAFGGNDVGDDAYRVSGAAPQEMAPDDGNFVPSGIEEPLALGASYVPDGGMAYPLGEGFNDPDMTAGEPAGPATSPEDMTEWDAMSEGLDGRVFEDGSIGWPGDSPPGGYPADDDDDEMAELQGADAADRGAEYASGYATDEDPTLPGRVNPAFAEGAPGGQGPGGWADDDDPEFPGAARPPGGMALADPRMPPEASGALEASAGAKVPTEPGSDPRALDYGLPTEGEIGNERGWDVLRQITGRLGNALRVAGGGSHRDIETVAPGMEAARREGIEGRLNAKGASAEGDRRATRDAELAEDVARARREPTELELSREARIAADSERDDALGGRRMELDERGLAGREGRANAEAASEAAMRDPASPASEAARARLSATLDALRSSPRTAPIAEAIGARLEGMSAYDVERIESGTMLRPLMGRGVGGGGGGGGGGSPTHDALVEAYMARTGSSREQAEALARAVGDRSFGRSLTSDGLTSTRAEESSERVLERRAAGDELVEGVHATVHMSEPAIRAWQNGWSTTRGSMDALRRIRSTTAEHGVSARITPAIRAQLETNMFPLRHMIADIQGTGVINPSEMAAINAALPDGTSMLDMTVGSFNARLNEWQRLVEDAIRHRMTDMGVNDEEVGRAMGALRSGGRIVRGGSRAPAEGGAGGAEGGEAPAGGTVRVRVLATGAIANLPPDVYDAHRDEVEVIDGP